MNKKTIITALLALVALTAFGQGNTIADTYWRNEQTGDWMIGFAEKHVIYNNKVWEIFSQTEKKDAYTLTADNGETIKVGKAKNGRRAITIGNGKPVVCSQITTATLPDYPTKDLTPFKDNGYRTGDTATIVGWLKDCPKELLDDKREFEIAAYSLFSNDDFSVYGKVDALGRFVVKIPVENTQMVLAAPHSLKLPVVLEPGETYFYLHDHKTGQQLMMGSNARMQNELLAYGMPDFEHVQPGRKMTARQIIDYKNRWASAYERNCATLDTFFSQHPTLSRRMEDGLRMINLTTVGISLMETIFNTKEEMLPAEVVNYIDSLVWPNVRVPYTFSREFGWFLHYYQRSAEQIETAQLRWLTPGLFHRMDKDGQISLSQEEQELMARWEQMNVAFENAASRSDREKLYKKHENLFNQLRTFIEKEAIEEAIAANILNPFVIMAGMIDSIYTDQLLRDINKARMLCQQIDETRTPLTDGQLHIIEQIQTPAAKQKVLSLNDKYLALQQRDISKMQSLKANDDLAGMSDGEQILRKITEPYRGRLILLDVWGTWCGPCKDAFSHSKEEFERLKDYNLVYLYLANRSEDEAWKNVIKEYDLTGDDIVHYNLPAAQQNAVEHFLNAHSYPSYRLIDRDGTVLDVNADPRDLEGLARLLEKLK